jgi:hypothetical protein
LIILPSVRKRLCLDVRDRSQNILNPILFRL